MFNKTEFEEIMIANWTRILDRQKVMLHVLKKVREHEQFFPVIQQENLPAKGIKISLSRFGLISNGFVIWVEFSVPGEQQLAVGTTEFHLIEDDLQHVETTGTLYRSNNIQSAN